MAKKKTAGAGSTQPDWKTKWPRNGDLATWFRYMLRKCEAISDDRRATDQAHLPIENLAELGHGDEAIRWVNRFLKRLKKEAVLETVQMAELGAKISLDMGKHKLMEKFLATAESTEPFNTRKCDREFSLNSVRDFRADNGILNPKDAVDDDQRIRAEFWGAHRRFKQAVDEGRKKQARQAVEDMEAVACGLKRRSRREQFLYFVVTGYADLQDADAVKRCIRRLDKHDRDTVLDAVTLLELGMNREAIARSKRDIAEDLEELATMNDPNIHFPAMSISRSLCLLFEQGEKNSAKRWLRRALREMPTWPALEFGWSTSAVYNAFAEAMALIEGAESAEQLLEQATRDGHLEKRPGFRQSAVSSAIDLKADVGRLEEAIEDARKLRSPKQRRKQLGKLLARAGRWKELHEVLCEVTSPEEAADVMWWIKFELPGGAVK